jgi:hypothetical protein
MPNKNGTGPKGKGALTGRGSGRCVLPLNTREEELSYLENQKKVLRQQLHQVETRVKAIKTVVSGGKNENRDIICRD